MCSIFFVARDHYSKRRLSAGADFLLRFIANMLRDFDRTDQLLELAERVVELVQAAGFCACDILFAVLHVSINEMDDDHA